MATILIADDHAVVRAGFKEYLKAYPSVSAVGEAASGSATLDEMRRRPWDLLLLDIRLPDRSGLEILEHVRCEFPQVPVLMMSGLPEEQYARTVLRAGASGYLSKGSAPFELLKAVRTVLAGHRYVSRALADLLAADLVHEDAEPLRASLSSREFEIFCRLAGGAGISAIARDLNVSVKTVSSYRARILVKSGFHNNADMTRYALRNGLIQ
jgi:DNA-binding NarL/FixJ family response regulator